MEQEIVKDPNLFMTVPFSGCFQDSSFYCWLFLRNPTPSTGEQEGDFHTTKTWLYNGAAESCWMKADYAYIIFMKSHQHAMAILHGAIIALMSVTPTPPIQNAHGHTSWPSRDRGILDAPLTSFAYDTYQ